MEQTFETGEGHGRPLDRRQPQPPMAPKDFRQSGGVVTNGTDRAFRQSSVREDDDVEKSGERFQRTNYFPTMVFQYDVEEPGELNRHLLDLVYAERERDRTGVNKSNTAELGSWHSHTGLHKNAEYGELLGHINHVTGRMSEELSYATDHSLQVTTMWSIINPPGNGNRAHIHPNCIWSGVYYVQAPPGAGEIEFVDPRTALIMNQAKYIPKKKRPRDCWTKVDYKPIAGRMLIFPAWLYHGVDPNVSKESGRKADRVIVSFNISQLKS